MNFLELFRALSPFAILTMAVAIAVFAIAVTHVFRPTALAIIAGELTWKPWIFHPPSIFMTLT